MSTSNAASHTPLAATSSIAFHINGILTRQNKEIYWLMFPSQDCQHK